MQIGGVRTNGHQQLPYSGVTINLREREVLPGYCDDLLGATGEIDGHDLHQVLAFGDADYEVSARVAHRSTHQGVSRVVENLQFGIRKRPSARDAHHAYRRRGTFTHIARNAWAAH